VRWSIGQFYVERYQALYRQRIVLSLSVIN